MHKPFKCYLFKVNNPVCGQDPRARSESITNTPRCSQSVGVTLHHVVTFPIKIPHNKALRQSHRRCHHSLASHWFTVDIKIPAVSPRPSPVPVNRLPAHPVGSDRPVRRRCDWRRVRARWAGGEKFGSPIQLCELR